MFGSTLVEHRLPSRKISGCSLIRQRSRLCSKPGKCRPHVFVLKGLSYHAAITSQYLVKAIQMFPLFEDRSVPELPLHDLCEDRKSTRLNSSHVAISYAVFCLKKKKQLDQ